MKSFSAFGSAMVLDMPALFGTFSSVISLADLILSLLVCDDYIRYLSVWLC